MASLSSTKVQVAQTSVTLWAGTTKTRKLILSNFSANNITVSGVNPAVASTGMVIPANSRLELNAADFTNTTGGRQYIPALYAISGTGTNDVGVAAWTE